MHYGDTEQASTKKKRLLRIAQAHPENTTQRRLPHTRVAVSSCGRCKPQNSSSSCWFPSKEVSGMGTEHPCGIASNKGLLALLAFNKKKIDTHPKHQSSWSCPSAIESIAPSHWHLEDTFSLRQNRTPKNCELTHNSQTNRSTKSEEKTSPHHKYPFPKLKLFGIERYNSESLRVSWVPSLLAQTFTQQKIPS